MTDKLESRLSAHFRAELDGLSPARLTLPARKASWVGWRVALVAGLAVAATLGGLSRRSGPPLPDTSVATTAELPVFLPISSQFIAAGDELGTVYLDDAPMQLIRNTGMRRTQYTTADGRTHLSIAVPAHEVYLTHYRVD